jgi:hypothetical protein
MSGLLVPKKYGGRKRSALCWNSQGVGLAQLRVQLPAGQTHRPNSLSFTLRSSFGQSVELFQNSGLRV